VISQQPRIFLQNLCFCSFAAKVAVKSLFQIIYGAKLLQDWYKTLIWPHKSKNMLCLEYYQIIPLQLGPASPYSFLQFVPSSVCPFPSMPYSVCTDFSFVCVGVEISCCSPRILHTGPSVLLSSFSFAFFLPSVV